ncbi:hypothetical protein HSR121_1622 [Halapricum desulfuricans]|uniref:Uncharacterized protein n=1 Tax=Halapricum desulfuricans TaxID=2841257 RepID=A0A897N4G1_9EURY|nr:hypothetical protein HSR121_1622 [Halapricum desulfuricans]
MTHTSCSRGRQKRGCRSTFFFVGWLTSLATAPRKSWTKNLDLTSVEGKQLTFAATDSRLRLRPRRSRHCGPVPEQQAGQHQPPFSASGSLPVVATRSRKKLDQKSRPHFGRGQTTDFRRY